MSKTAYEYRTSVELDDQLQRVNVGLVLAAGDSLANRFSAEVFRAGQPVDVAGSTVRGYFIRPQGATIVLTGTAAGSTVHVDLSKNCYIEAGSFSLALKISQGSATQTLLIVDGRIARTSTDTIVDPEHVIPSLEDLLAQIDRMEQGTAAASAAAGKASTAASMADSKAALADSAAKAATTAAQAATAAAGKIDGMTATAKGLPAGAAPTAAVTEGETGKVISLGIPKGNTGATPALSMGVVTTGAPGSQAQASLRGTAEAPILDMTIPAGETGSIDNLTINGQAVQKGQIKLTGEHIPVSGADTRMLAAALGTKVDKLSGKGLSTNDYTTAEKNKLAGLPLSIYPVGSIYIAVNGTSPASLFGGKWEQLKDRFLVGVGSNYAAGATGGFDYVYLTDGVLPAHTHTVTMARKDGSPVSWSSASAFGRYSGDAGGASFTMPTSSAGSGTALENRPPYLAVYMWKRVA